MKHKIGFQLDGLEMLLVLCITFFAGMVVAGTTENNYLYTGMLLLSVGILIFKKKIRIPIN
jgi:LPXTG-motif cell wall-anchored protein